jgi:hypothetical protein
MKFIQIPLSCGANRYVLNDYSGNLHTYAPDSGISDELFQKKIANTKLDRALNGCKNPYTLGANKGINERVGQITQKDGVLKGNRMLQNISQRLNFLCRFNFKLACFYTNLQKSFFQTSADALIYYRKNVKGDQSQLCLPRTLFAAKTSREFKESGVLFIGVFLPSRNMHAWIIENDQVADPVDPGWTNFRPVAALL